MAISGGISSKGQITLPIEVRQRLGLKTGDRVDFVLEEGRTIVLPVRTQENPFIADVGLVPAFGSVEDINDWITEMRGRGPLD